MALISVETARNLILEKARITELEEVPLKNCLGRIIGIDHSAKRTQPPFDASAMDGYAINFSDNQNGKTLKIIGESAAGHRFSGAVSKGECVRIFTGAPLPKGTDTIIIQENITRENDNIILNECAPSKGHYVRPAGLDFKEGETGLKADIYLSPEKISYAAAMGYSHITVRKKPKVVVISLGDELCLPGEICGADQIISSNGFALCALIEKYGGDAIDLGIIKDTAQATTAAFKKAISLEPDIIISSGGASVGDHDFAQTAYQSLNISTTFWKIAMRPGKPLMMGHLNGITFLGLPGNPVSSMVCSHIFLRPLLASMTKYKEYAPSFSIAKLKSSIPPNDIREEFMRGKIEEDKDHLLVTAFDKQDSSILSLAAAADCLIQRPALSPQLPAGTTVSIIKL